MFNRNAFKTALIFLGIIFIGIAVNLFLNEDELFVKNSETEVTANVGCLGDGDIC